MKKRVIIPFIIGAAAIVYIMVPDGSDKHGNDVHFTAAASSKAERIGYFASHGWNVEEIAQKDIIVPESFSALYEEYASLQDKQGMPLREYAGREAQLYVYEVKNYSPESRKMLAELIVCDDLAIASMVYSEDGESLRLAVS